MTLPRLGILVAVLMTALFAATASPALAVAPTVTALNPTSGSTLGGNDVVITGDNFTGATGVTFGGVPGTDLVINTDEQITVTAPAHAAGAVDVVVTNPDGNSGTAGSANDYNYVTPAAPTVTAVNPTGGPAAGGNVVTITGTGFSLAPATGAVTFGGTVAPYVVNNDTTITANAPAHAAGTVQVEVTTPAGSSADTLADNYTYGATAPTVTGVNPTGGPTTGGNLVTITGTGFGTSGSPAVTSISFGGTNAPTFSVTNDTTLTVLAPAHAAGSADVLVTTANGTSTNTIADNYVYGVAPTITSVAPGAGTTAGGTTLIITGTGFSGATAVTIGGTAATTYIINSDTQITATTPAHAAGTVDVVVTTPGGASANTTGDNFVYTAGPIVTDVAPATGTTAGGTSVVITGVNLTGATSVTFGGTAATSFTVNSGTQITAVAPAHAAGNVDIIVTTPLGVSVNTADDNFTYGAVPTITGITPVTGPIAGGTTVTITGTGFTGATAVLFGTTAATSFTVVNDTTITAVAPAGASGAVSVRVTTPLGQTADTANDNFTYGTGTTTTTYTLYFRWTLIVWQGRDNADVEDALNGQETPANPNTNDISGVVTAIFRYNNPQQRFEGYFPGSEGIPGANDFTTFRKGEAYWIAISQSGTVSWTVLTD
jgi:hypothetical protein